MTLFRNRSFAIAIIIYDNFSITFQQIGKIIAQKSLFTINFGPCVFFMQIIIVFIVTYA